MRDAQPACPGRHLCSPWLGCEFWGITSIPRISLWLHSSRQLPTPCLHVHLSVMQWVATVLLSEQKHSIVLPLLFFFNQMFVHDLYTHVPICLLIERVYELVHWHPCNPFMYFYYWYTCMKYIIYCFMCIIYSICIRYISAASWWWCRDPSAILVSC